MRAVLLLCALLGATSPPASSRATAPHRHPLHTSFAELTEGPRAGTVAIVVRAFADDFGAAAGSSGPGPAADSAANAYLRRTLALADAAGHPVPLRFHDRTMRGDLVWIRLEAALPGGLVGVRVRHAVLCERFGDQVNLVRATYAGRTTTLLFVPGDGARRLP